MCKVYIDITIIWRIKIENLIGMIVYHTYPSQGIIQSRIRKILFKTKWIIYDESSYGIEELGKSIFFDYDEAKEYEFSQLNKRTARQLINTVSKNMDNHNSEIDTLYRLLKKYPTEESRKHYHKNCGNCVNVSDDCIAGICRECMEDEVTTGKFENWNPDLEKLKELWIQTEN